VVKTKLNNLFSNNENKVGIAIDNPSSRYKHVLQYVNTSDCLLDIACGKGGGTRLIAQNAKSVIGIDYNEDYIKDGSKNLPSNIDLLCGTDELLNNYSDYFEKIVSLHTLEHVSNDLLFLKRIYKSLKNGGRLIIEVPRLMPIPIGEPLWPFHEREYSHKTMLHLFELSGFLVEVIKGGNRGDYVNLEEAREVLFYVCKKQC